MSKNYISVQKYEHNIRLSANINGKILFKELENTGEFEIRNKYFQIYCHVHIHTNFWLQKKKKSNEIITVTIIDMIQTLQTSNFPKHWKIDCHGHWTGEDDGIVLTKCNLIVSSAYFYFMYMYAKMGEHVNNGCFLSLRGRDYRWARVYRPIYLL